MVTRRDAPDIGIRRVAALHWASLVVAEEVVDRNANIAIVDIAVAVVVAVLGDDESIDDDDGDMVAEAAVGNASRNCCHNFHRHLLDREVASTYLCGDDNFRSLE